MARTDTLAHYLTDVADAIRTKTGSSDPIQASTFDTAISNIPSGATYTVTSGQQSTPNYQKIMEQINTVKVDDDATSLQYLFYNCKATSFPKVTNVTNKITNMQYMFAYCDYVTSLDFSGYDTSKVTTMKYMFGMNTGGSPLHTLDLSSFDTTEVTDMSSMFNLLRNLAVLDISNFDFSSVTNFAYMFKNCGDWSLQSNGAYDYGIPYVYVKDAAAQTWVLTQSNGHPSSWSTDNVIIKSNNT